MNRFLFIWLILIVLAPTQVYSQLNIRVAYTPSYVTAGVNNEIINLYNAENPWLDDKMNRLYVMHGLQIGARFKTNFLALEAGWERLNRRRDAYGINPATESYFSEDLVYYANTFFLGLDMYIGPVGLGMHLSATNFSVQSNLSQFKTKISYMRDQELSTRMMLAFRITSLDNFEAYLKPFAQIPITGLDFRPLAENLIPDSINEIEDYTQGLQMFGISLIFYNGPQEQ